MSALKQLKEHVDTLGTVYKLGSLAFTALSAASAAIIRSHTLAAVIVAAALSGGVIAFLVAACRYAGLSQQRRSALFRKHVLCAVVAFAVVVSALLLADPGIAAFGSPLARMREILLTAILLFNVIVAAGTFGFVYAGVTSIVITAPRVSGAT